MPMSLQGLPRGRSLFIKHIRNEDHSTGIKFSRFNGDINELIEKYGKAFEKSAKQSKAFKGLQHQKRLKR